MTKEYTKDYFWEVYKQLPEELKDALFSDKNNEVISHICAQAGLNEEQTALVAKYTGRVIMGLLPLHELPITIELELNISQDLAGQIHKQIYISIFKHLRVSLNKINQKNNDYTDSFTSSKDGILKKEEPAPKPFDPHKFSSGRNQLNSTDSISAKLNQSDGSEVFIPNSKIINKANQEKSHTPEVFKENSNSSAPEVFKPQVNNSPVVENKEVSQKEEVFKPEPKDNPLFSEDQTIPKIPTRDAFKDSLKDINVEEIKIPEKPEINSANIPTQITENTPGEENSKNNDPYKEAPL